MPRRRYSSDQATARRGSGAARQPLEAVDLGAKLRPAYFRFAAEEALAPGSVIEVVSLPSGKLRVFPHLSVVYARCPGSLDEDLDVDTSDLPILIGHEGFDRGLGRKEPAHPHFLGSIKTNRYSPNLGIVPLDLWSVSQPVIVLTCPDGLPEDTHIEGILVYGVD